MKYRNLFALVFLLCAGSVARADVTIRHTMTYHFGSFLPPAATDAIKQQMEGQLPKETVVHVKGKKVYTSLGAMVMITDYEKGVITLLDPKGKRFATSPLASYADKIAAAQKMKMPPMTPQMQQAFEGIKVDVKTDRTGKTATIQGIGAEETLLTISVEFPNPTGPGMQMRMEMHHWTATAEEVARVPALKEMEAYASLPKNGTDPTEMMTKMLGNIPGLADKLRGAAEEMMKSTRKAGLRTQTAVYMPLMAQMMPGTGDQPVTEFNSELAEFSTASLPDSQFEVPADYQTASMEDLVGAIFPSPKPAIGSGTAAPATPMPRPPLPPGVERVGNGVTPPAVTYRVEPSYTEEARAARIQGSVVLNVIVGTDGSAKQVSVLRSLDPGLDRQAVETVGTWKFRPGMKNGQPVAVQAQIEVNFRLM